MALQNETDINEIRELLYYEMQQKFIRKCIKSFITKCDNLIKKYDSYKLWQVYFKMWQPL